jgi:hypothetical protein
MCHRHTFDGRETQPAGGSEGGAESVDESHHDSNIRSHEKYTYRILQDFSYVDSDQMVVAEEDDTNQSLVSEGLLEVKVVSLRAPTCCRGCRLLLLRRKRNRKRKLRRCHRKYCASLILASI